MKRVSLLLLAFFFSSHSLAFIHTVSSVQEFQAAISSLEPGDIIQVAPGKYDIGEVTITTSGSQTQPIRIQALQRGTAEFIGSSKIILREAEFIHIEGFLFTSIAPPAIRCEGCNNIRMTRNTFRLDEKREGSWVFIDGSEKNPDRRSHHNRIDHNLFEKKSLLGNFITVEGTKKPSPIVSQYDRIDHNHLRDIGPRVENVLEAIRIGSSVYTLSPGYTRIEENLFERCDGDPEYISIKSSNDFILNNTFIECLGSLSLRHGNGSRVEGNTILGKNRTGTFRDSTGKIWTLGTGGVRFCGDSMAVVDNHFEELTGTNWDATLAVTNGDADYGQGLPLTKHFRIRYALITSNIFVNNKGGIEIGYDGGGFQGNWWKLPPQEMIISNNIIVGSSDTLIKLYVEPVNTRWDGNLVCAKGSATVSTHPIAGIKNVTEKELPPLRFKRSLTAKDVGPDASE